MRRRPRDRDFVETAEGFFFCVVGYLHPADRYTAYLKYTPAAGGRWARGGISYRRELPYYHVQNVVKTLAFLEREFPRYIWRDPIRDLRFSFVPHEAVVTYYLPEERLARIVDDPADRLETEVRDLVTRLRAATGLPRSAFGITGSTLLGLHDPSFSDIDLIVYGAANARLVQRALGALGPPFAPLGVERRQRWRAETARRFGLAEAEVVDFETTRWNYFLFSGRYVSVHPTRAESEIAEEYGMEPVRRLGEATIEARVVDASEALFLPAVYRLADSAGPDGAPVAIDQVVSFEGLYCGVAEAGDRIRARGVVEEAGGLRRLVVGVDSVEDGGSLRIIARSGSGAQGDGAAPTP